ncbi:MAG: amidase domain-containing protein [Chloroflexi bacterium]|nr:amidase domain-containing protein [Chloroflexota bacterium]
MTRNLKASNSKRQARTLLLTILVLVLTSAFAKSQKTVLVGNVPDNVKAMLADYSQHLNSGKTLHKSFYSNAMETLIQDRRDYYSEFYGTGLHTNLTSITSEMYIEDTVVTKTGNVYHIEILETVTMFGYPNLDSSEDYPMIPAARWAILNTNNDNVRQALERYIASTTDAVNDSIANGVETVFRIRHKIDIVDTKNGQTQFSKDVFTDKEIDNGSGFDNVNWINGHSARAKSDFTQMPDYIIYIMPIEALGKQLLNDYTKSDSNSAPSAVAASFTYARTSAANYRAYSSNTTLRCPGNSAIFQNTAVYNQLAAYKAVWTTTGCDDCTNYVSQALRQGGFPTDTIWKFTPAPGTYTWKVSDYSSSPQGLFYWLDNTWAATTQYNNTSIQLGDLITDSYYSAGGRNHGAGHVVIVTRIAPTKFSGHTNDRKDYAWTSAMGLNYFWHIKDNLFH